MIILNEQESEFGQQIYVLFSWFEIIEFFKANQKMLKL